MKIRKSCRICASKLIKIISLKKISLVGNFFKRKGDKKKYPITLNYCKNCKHVQISEIISPKKLFINYFWETSVTNSSLEIFRELVKTYRKKFSNKTKVLEIASNDGSFLKYLHKKFKCFLLGVDPAKNIFKKQKEINFINDFFNYSISKLIYKTYGKFDLIFARNVLAHVSDPNIIFKSVKKIIANNGVFIVEVPYLLPILKNLQYDNIFHEHQGFYSLKSIDDLCKKNNMFLSNFKIIKSQGGSIRCEIKNEKVKNQKKIINFINYEKKSRLFEAKYLKKFGLNIIQHSNILLSFLENLKSKNKKISAYGASGKGQALLQYSSINNRLIDMVYDKSDLKKDRFTPGTNIKITSPKYINKKNIDFLLILSWNIKNEIMRQEKKFRNSGGKFIIPFPEPKIIK